jgi:sugar phosphate isomerase/epimerase
MRHGHGGGGLKGFPMISRRTLLRTAGALPPFRSLAAPADSHTLETIGVQLYTVRDLIDKGDPAEVLNALDRIGYRKAEVIWASLDKVWPALTKTRMRPVSIHMDSELFQPDKRAQLAAAIDTVKKHGFEYLVYPAVPKPERSAGLDRFWALADTLNEAGAQCRRAGLKLCYHNHAFDFRPIGSSTPWEVYMTRTDPGLVAFELDIFWVSVAGHDPIDVLKLNPGRCLMMHVKNKPSGMPVQFNEEVPDSAFREAGNGVLEIAAILRAATDNGVQHCFVEQDKTPGNPVDSLRQSYEYLRKLKY